MIDPPRILDSTTQITAVIKLTVPRAEIQNVMGPAIGELMAGIAAQGITPAGPIYSHHFRQPTETFDFEVGVPVSAPVKPAGRVMPSELPATKVARTIYHGGYEGLGGAWGELCSWITANGHQMAVNLWERYLKGPESSQNPADWETELNRPVLG